MSFFHVPIRGIGLIRNGQNQWFHYNARGDVVGLSNSAGDLVRTYRYDAFGNEINSDILNTHAFVHFHGAARTVVNRPGSNEEVESVLLQRGFSVPVAHTAWMALEKEEPFILEFEYWTDGGSSLFNVDLFPDDLPEYHLTATPEVQSARLVFQSGSNSMGNCMLRFFNDLQIPNPSNIFIANIRFYSESETGNDPNPFRYAGEYFDTETGTYYLRARYYNPRTGRFLTEDPHWNIGNMIFGDNPVKWHEREGDPDDPLGLNTYTLRPDILAIKQSGNLYVYCIGNPIMYRDPTGLTATRGKPQAQNDSKVTKGNPPTQNDGYVAPRGGPVQGKDKNGKTGWVDKNGNVWVPVPDGTPSAHGGGHWDVQRPDGKGYVNRYPGGRERPGSGKAPNIPRASQFSVDWGLVLTVTIVVVAIAGAPKTGGASLGLLKLARV